MTGCAHVSGVGSALAYTPTIILVGLYFEKRRSLANGLTVAGSGVGNFAFPPLMRLLLDHYGLGGTLLVMAGCMLNVCVCGALLRPLSSYTPRNHATLLVEGLEKQQAPEKGEEPKDGRGDARWCSESLGDASDSCIPATAEADLTEAEDAIQIVPSESTDLNLSSSGQSVRLSTLGNGAVRSTTPTEQSPPTSMCSCLSNNICIRAAKDTKFDWQLLKNPVFLVYGFSLMLCFCGYPNIFMILPSHCKTIGIPKARAAYLVSIIGILDMVGRVFFGWFSDLNLIKKRYIFTISMAISGVACAFLPLMRSFEGLAVLCAVIGLFAGSFVALIAPILAESLGVERLPSAFGLAMMFQGLAFLFAPPTVGQYTYMSSFFICV